MPQFELPARFDDEAPISRFEAFTAMEQYGGGFLGTLGTALSRADGQNTRKIMANWEDEIRQVVGYLRKDTGKVVGP